MFVKLTSALGAEYPTFVAPAHVAAVTGGMPAPADGIAGLTEVQLAGGGIVYVTERAADVVERLADAMHPGRADERKARGELGPSVRYERDVEGSGGGGMGGGRGIRLPADPGER